MFPYPSGEGLHVGHPKGYIATDVISRMKRMQGFNVLHPMGFDAFGLPAENYAIKTKTNPMVSVAKNVEHFKKQLEIIGLDYDWSREINTTDPAYYKWTQWIFLQLYKKGLAYESDEPVNWCPTDKTVLANEDVENGRCERCGTPIEKRPMRQWVLKITDYADSLLNDLDAADYVMPVLIDKTNPHQPGKPIVKRDVAHAIVFDPKNRKYLIIRNKKHGWDTVIIGGIENGESAEETARREVKEETGYIDIEFKRLLGGKTEAHYYAKHKGENRIAFAQAAYFELKSDKRMPIAEGEDKDDEVLWIDEKDFVPGKMVNSELPIWMERLKDPHAGWPKPLLEWPESIKVSQRNWIGRSEGALIKFKVQRGEVSLNKDEIEVFTTRPDTLFGVTYVVLAPEHKLVKELLSSISNKAEVEAYISKTQQETEIERTDTKREKTGVELKGIKTINPANNEVVPVWIADYVLADYGTGAVMAVPAHDERDWEFAKKFGLPIKYVIAPDFIGKGIDAPRIDVETLKRDVVDAIIENNKGEFLLEKEVTNGVTHIHFVGGGTDGEEDEIAVLREVTEETGYTDLNIVRKVGNGLFCYTFRHTKNKNQNTFGAAYHIRLKSENKIKSEADAGRHMLMWVARNEVGSLITWPHHLRFWNDFLNPNEPFIKNGRLITFGIFNGKDSESAKIEITKSVGGQWVTKYKLRDWVFSRQRYWGEPIPLIHCAKCGVVPVPEKDLPVKLPRVKSYEPTGTGESPLAAIEKWVNVKCPKCKGPARRETNTMPQWAGSCWYYLRYMDPDNKKALVDSAKEKYWSPVDLYVGGAEHATRHLIYARFWHKFLNDIDVVSTSEPFKRLQSVGLIIGEDGRKMSKRFGNVVDPDDVVRIYGADTLRMYEMFMGPFDQSIAWSMVNIIGSRRFIERIWRLYWSIQDKKDIVSSSTIDRTLQNAVKKVTSDIENMRFNTAVSTLMIVMKEIESGPGQVSRDQFEILLKLAAPFAPHFTEELWTLLGNKKSIHLSDWPAGDLVIGSDALATIIVQVNGKTRGSFTATIGMEKDKLEKMAREAPEAVKWTSGKEVKRVIVVPDRLVNIVVDN